MLTLGGDVSPRTGARGAESRRDREPGGERKGERAAVVVNDLIREYGILGLVLSEVSLLLVGLCFLALQYGARQAVMQRARPGSAVCWWGTLLAEEGAGVIALLTVFSLGGWVFGSWRWGLALGCGFVLLLVLLAVLGELLLGRVW